MRFRIFRQTDRSNQQGHGYPEWASSSISNLYNIISNKGNAIDSHREDRPVSWIVQLPHFREDESVTTVMSA